MPDATLFARRWAGLVAQVRPFGAYAARASLLELGGMLASVMPVAPASSLANVSITVDPTAPPSRLGEARKWRLWLAGDGNHAEERSS